jgi:outer membrane usher protein
MSRYFPHSIGVALSLITLSVSAQQTDLVLSRTLTEAHAREVQSDPLPTGEVTPFATNVEMFPFLRLTRELSASTPPRRAPARPVTTAPQAMVLTIMVNGEPKGDRIVYLSGKNEFLIKRADLQELAKIAPQAQVTEIEGDSYVVLNTLPGAGIVFEEKSLVLNLTLPPEAFGKQIYNLVSTHPADAARYAANSALLNYRLGYLGASGSSNGTWSLATEEAVNWGRWLLRNQSYHLRTEDQTTSLRYVTQLVRDDRADMHRLVIGDEFTAGGELGAAVQIGGVSFSKAYQLSPYFVRQPSVNFAGTVALPSDVDFYVGNTRVLHEHISPGPFEIANFNYYGGQRNVRVVVRDMFGREQTVSYPFYFTDQGLAQGLHDYSYQLGYLRENFGVASNDYGKLAFSAFHKYGVSDSLTLGLRGEGTSEYGNLGPNLVYRSDHLGLLAASVAGSRDRVAQKQGSALSVAHSYQVGDFSSYASLRRFSDFYAMLHAGVASELPRRQISFALGYSPSGFGSLNLSYNRLDLADKPETKSAILGYSRPLFGKLNLLASYRRDFGDASGFEFFFGFQYVPGPDLSASASLRRDNKKSQDEQIQFGNTLPAGEGLGYRLTLERTRDQLSSLNTLSPELRYNTRYSALSAEVHSQSGSASRSTSYSLAAAGGVAAVGGVIGLSRPINDSFGIAQITPPIAGVRVFQNSQEIGRTDENGKLFLPSMAAFIDNYVSISDKDIPIEYSIERVDRVISPAYRSGSIVNFSVQRTQSIVGTLKYRLDGVPKPLEYHLISLDAGDHKVTFPTAKNGDFYLENIAPGEHAANVRIGNFECKFNLAVPETSESLVTLKEIQTCNVDR